MDEPSEHGVVSATLPHEVAALLWQPSLGAWLEDGGVRFRVWAPRASSIDVALEQAGAEPRIVPLSRGAGGWFSEFVPECGAGDRYWFRIDGQALYPDPASRYQPEGVHGPSEIVDSAGFDWSDQGWPGLSPEELVIYELHIGTFSAEGTFAGAVKHLEALRDLGVTAIELMPVAEFAGNRNWGYDGVDLFAPAHCYGTPDDLRGLVNEAHRLGLGVILDVVYNHFGPAGNYTLQFSEEYLSRWDGTWGGGVNLDGAGSQQVREFFIENALHWLNEYHIDGLRLDATHALLDTGSPHFLEDLSERVHQSVSGRWAPLIAEDSRNLDLLIRAREEDGWGLDAVWSDDFHHALRRLLAGDDRSYYQDYLGTTSELATTINQGWLYTGQFSRHLGGLRGTKPAGLPPCRFIFCIQNHDQVGNRAFGDRLNHGIDLASYRAATALLLTAPQVPLLFMGQEWAASTPFQYFTDHEEELGRLVTEGRQREFPQLVEFGESSGSRQAPGPQELATFERSKLEWPERELGHHATTLRLYQTLLARRRSEPGLRSANGHTTEAFALDAGTLLVRREAPDGERIAVFVRLKGRGRVGPENHPALSLPRGWRWEVVLTTEDSAFALDPVPVAIDLSGPAPVLVFDRPAAVILKARPIDGAVR